jgi:acylphosphatase
MHLSGRVQGVGFRYGCARQARALGLTGWVRNGAVDQVEVHAEGAAEALAQLADWCRHGPPGASVNAFTANNEPARGCFQTFTIEP